MSNHDAGLPAARAIEAHDYRDDVHADPAPSAWLPRWTGAVVGVALALVVVLTDLDVAAVAAAVVVVGASTVQARRTGTRWWTVLEVVLLVVVAGWLVVGTRLPAGLTPVEIAVQALVGALVGGLVVALAAVVRRRRAARPAARRARPTGV